MTLAVRWSELNTGPRFIRRLVRLSKFIKDSAAKPPRVRIRRLSSDCNGCFFQRAACFASCNQPGRCVHMLAWRTWNPSRCETIQRPENKKRGQPESDNGLL